MESFHGAWNVLAPKQGIESLWRSWPNPSYAGPSGFSVAAPMEGGKATSEVPLPVSQGPDTQRAPGPVPPLPLGATMPVLKSIAHACELEPWTVVLVQKLPVEALGKVC